MKHGFFHWFCCEWKYFPVFMFVVFWGGLITLITLDLLGVIPLIDHNQVFSSEE